MAPAHVKWVADPKREKDTRPSKIKITTGTAMPDRAEIIEPLAKAQPQHVEHSDQRKHADGKQQEVGVCVSQMRSREE